MAKMKFLVIQQKMIGDVLVSTIICESLKSAYPDCIVHFLANHNTLAILKNNPYIDKVIVFEEIYRLSRWEFFKFLKSIRKEFYHGVIDAYGKPESNLISLFAKSKFKISQAKWYTKWIYTNTLVENLKPDGEIPLAIQNRLQLLNPILGKANTFISNPKIFLIEEEIIKAQTELIKVKSGQDQKVIMISILGSSAIKTYPSAYMAQVLDSICSLTDARLLFNYMPNQKKEVLAIYKKCKKETQACIALDFYSESLREFFAILAQCDALIGNEGGAVNMAKALNIPTFCLFSPFIMKNAWHDSRSSEHIGIHLKDYKPALFKNLDKKEIKTNSANLYAAFEPNLFRASLTEFLIKTIQHQEEVSK